MIHLYKSIAIFLFPFLPILTLSRSKPTTTLRSRNHNRRLLYSAVLLGALWLLLLLLAACGSEEAPEVVDPYARYRPAMRPESSEQLDQLGPLPRYEITISYDPVENVVTGAAEVLVPNTSPDPWNELYFRLYPNLEQYGGGLTINNVRIANRPQPFDYATESTAMRIDLAEPILAGSAAVIQLNWELNIPVWSDNSGVYALFGSSQNLTSLPLFYPSLALYRPDVAAESDRWWLDMGSVRGDAAFNPASLFVVTATFPSNLSAVTGATLVTTTQVSAEQTQHVWVTGPVREVFLQFSPILASASLETMGTKVISYWLPEDEAAGRATLNYAVAALRIYNDFYGEYPFRDLVVVPGPLSYRGMEYPGLSQIGTEVYNQFRENLEVLVAHEVAHQWWYQVVHNDPVNEPWLDESLAEYSVKLYMQKLRGSSEADLLQMQRWLAPLAVLRSRGADDILDRPVDAYLDGGQYETLVYGKGALFYDELRSSLGDRQFFKFLQGYVAEHRYQVVTSQDWLHALEKLGKPDLVRLYREWVTAPKAGAQEAGSGQQPANGP